MKATDSVMVTTTYHPKPGYEDPFLSIWNKKIKSMALASGATWASIYHNEDTEEFIFNSHWPLMSTAEAFLESAKYKKAMKDLNKLSLIPPARAVCEIFN